VVREVNDTETIVTGLTPGVLYTFSVSAENDVSSQDNNTNARSLSTTNTTEEGGLYTPLLEECNFSCVYLPLLTIVEGGLYTLCWFDLHH
jgi:hypothetical protein